MTISYTEFKNRISKIDDYPGIILEARTQAGVTQSQPAYVYTRDEIPFNLETEYFDLLLDENRLKEARIVLDRMKNTYNTTWHNLIEANEYRLSLIEKTHRLLNQQLAEAKKEFNQHSLFVITVIAGVITIFGTANQAFTVSNFDQAIQTFFSISAAVIILVAVAQLSNHLFHK